MILKQKTNKKYNSSVNLYDFIYDSYIFKDFKKALFF